MHDKGTTRAIAVALGAVVLGGYLYHVAGYWTQINDEAFITFRYSRNLVLGRGSYFNEGEHVEGYTNFLMMLTMAGAIALFGPDDVLFAAKLVGVIGGLIAIVGAWLLCARWLARIKSVAPLAYVLAWAAGALVASSAAFAVNSTSGLETTQYSALILIGLCLLQFESEQKRWLGSAAAFALAALARPEGALVFLAILAARLLLGELRAAGRRRLAADAMLVAGVVLIQLAFRLAYYDGQWLPNVFYAKMAGQPAGGALAYLWVFAGAHLGGALALVVIVPLLFGDEGLRPIAVASVVVLVAGIVVVLQAGPDGMLGFRLLAPYVPIWAALAVCGFVLIFDRIGVRPAIASGAACAGFVVLVFWMQAPFATMYRVMTNQRAEGYAVAHGRLADWLTTTAEPGQSVALTDVGLIGYRCIDLRIIDLTGLTDRTIAKSPGGFLSKEFDPVYVLDQNPEFLVIVNGAPRRGADLDPSKLARLTPIEEAIVQSDRFGEHYYRPAPPGGDDPISQLKAMFGAQRVDMHLHPAFFYFLTTYRYDPNPPALRPVSRPASQPALPPASAPATRPTSRPAAP